MLNDAELGEKLAAQTAPRVTPARLDEVIANTTFYNHGLLTICVLDLVNGFTVTGESACAAPENYNEAIGQKIAADNAKSKIWLLEGYLLRQKLHDASNGGAQ